MADLADNDLLEALEARLDGRDDAEAETRQKRQRQSADEDGAESGGSDGEGGVRDTEPSSGSASRGRKALLGSGKSKTKRKFSKPSSKRAQRADNELSNDDDDDDSDGEDEADDDENEDDDDEDDDDDEGAIGRKSGRHRRMDKSVSQYFDDAADEDEDEGSHRHKTAEERILQQEERIRQIRAEEQAKRDRLAAQRSAEEIAADITERAKASRYIETAAEEEEAAQASGRGSGPGLLSQTDLPTLRDPRLFLLHCKENREQEIVVALCNKFIETAGQGRKLAIASAMTTSKGIIYVEAYREAHVRAALAGIPDVYAWRAGAIKMMRPEDAPTALTVKTKASQLVRGGWVRMTRGDYKGDLAKVVDLLDNGSKVLIQAVPRINFQRLGMTKEQRQSLKSRGARPAQRLYNRAEVVAAVAAAGGSAHPETRMTRFGLRCDYFQGSNFYEGFLYRECPSSHVTVEGASPAVEELRKFRPQRNADADGLEDEDPAMLAEALQQKEEEWQKSLSMDLGSSTSSSSGAAGRGGSGSAMEAKIANGDAVVVAHGDLQGIEGRVVSIDESTNSLLIRPEADMARELGLTELRLLIRDVMKTFDVGTRVKVVGGMHSGQTGMVIVTQPTEAGEHSAVLTLDAGNKRVEVLVRHLRETREVVTAVGDLQGFQLYDQVELPSAVGQINESGCVVGMGVTDLLVMDSSGKVERRPPSQVRHRRNPRAQASTAIDSTYQAVRVGDVVKVTEGPRKGMDGVVKHTAGGILFLYSIKETKNSGMFVERSTSTVLAGAGSRGSGSAAAAAAALGISGAAAVAPAGMGGVSGMAKATGLMLSSGGGGGGRGRGRGANDPDRLLNAPVRIVRGTYKRMMGVVRQLQGDSVQVELHSGQRKVTVPKTFVRKESQTPGGAGAGGRMSIEQLRAMAKSNRAKAGAAASTASYGTAAYGRTAQYGTAQYNRTAQYGTAQYNTAQYGTAPNATPRYGSHATPGGGGGATPAYGGGSATPAYGDGSATPAYADGSATSSSMWQAATPGPSEEDHDAEAESGSLPVLCTRGAMVRVTMGPSAGLSGVVEEASSAHEVQVTLADGKAVTLPVSSLQAQLPSNNSLVLRVGDGAEGYVQGDVTTTDTSEEVPVRFSSGAVEMQKLADLVAIQR